MNRRKLLSLLSLIPFVKLKYPEKYNFIQEEKYNFIQEGKSQFALLKIIKLDEPVTVMNGETLNISYNLMRN